MSEVASESLNPEQYSAVTHGDGPLLIIAGAGTGKTKVITHRIAHLIKSGINPNQILALTFTEKAAGEMEERVDRLVPYGYSNVWISTFHSFGDRVLRDNALEIGLVPDFKVLSDAERIIFLREHLFELPLNLYRPLGNPTRYLAAILNLISRAKDEDVTPEEYIAYTEKRLEEAKRSGDSELQDHAERQMELARTYKAYQGLMAREGYLDFGDQVVLTLKLFRTRPAILRRYQERFRYILVDEFQDTNYAQFQLVKLLAERHRNITVVGDDDQCLPPDTLIETSIGPRRIKDIAVGEKVITAVGKGYTSTSKVTKIFKKKKVARFLTFETEKGRKVTVTDNHKMFCFVPSHVGRNSIDLGIDLDAHLETKFSVGAWNIQQKPAQVMPASNVLPGYYLPIIEGVRIIYDKVTDITEEIREEEVYDLEVDRTHNFIANKIVVHNSIYKFRGAAISNILNFKESYQDAGEIILTKNYRSHQSILDAAYRLISHNNPDRLEVKSGIDKRLVSEIGGSGGERHVFHGQGIVVKHLHFDTPSKEAETVAEMVEGKVKEGYRYKDIAILVRANNDADPFLKALGYRGIPHRFSGNRGLYSREEIRLMIAFLKAITNYNDSLSLFHLASSGVYQLKAEDLIPLHNISQRSHRPLYYVMKSETRNPRSEITPEGLATITKLIQDIDLYSQMAVKERVGRVLYTFLTSSGYLSRLTQEASSQAVEEVQNIARFFEIIRHMEETISLERTPAFVEHLNLLIEAGDDPGTAEPDIDADWVQVLTVHKAKGLEFPIVFMVGLVADRFPRRERKEDIELPEGLIRDILPVGDFHLQEERRLFYVGMTRAMKELYLTSASDYGGARPKKVSQFVLEALDMPRSVPVTIRTKPLEVIEGFRPLVEGVSVLPPIPDDTVLTLSYYQIDDYLTCPLKYKYAHILRVPLLLHHTIMYGNAIHSAVSTYFKRRLEGSHIPMEGLIEAFVASWRSEGFVTREHELHRLQAGKDALKRFYEAQERDGIRPSTVERDFVVDLGSTRLKGRWDLIEERDDGPYIIDFKTSDVREKEIADKKARDSIQLLLYTLAYRECFKRLPAGVELHFLESGLVGRACFGDKEIGAMLSRIEEVGRGIRVRGYTPRPDYLNCRWCAFNNICPATASP